MPRNRRHLPVDLAALRVPRNLSLTVVWREGRHLAACPSRLNRNTITSAKGKLRRTGADREGRKPDGVPFRRRE